MPRVEITLRRGETDVAPDSDPSFELDVAEGERLVWAEMSPNLRSIEDLSREETRWWWRAITERKL